MAIKKANNKSKLPQKKQTHTANAKESLLLEKNIILLKKNLENKDTKLLVKLIQFLLKQKMLRMVIFYSQK